MTVVNNVPRKIVAGPVGAPWNTAITFEFFDTVEIEVRRRVTATGVETVLLLSVDYTITGGAGNTGTLNGISAIAAGETWILSRLTDQTQDINYQELDRFPAESHEQALDRLVLSIQELNEIVTRIPLIAKGDTSLDLTIPRFAARQNTFWFWDAAGKPTAVQVVLPGGALAASVYMLNTFFALASAADVRNELAAVQNAGNIPKVQKGTAASKPGAGAFGQGIFVESDTGFIQHCDAAVYTQAVLRQLVFASLPNTTGILGFATDRKQIYVGTGAAKAKVRAYPPRFLSGGQTSRSAVTQITFSEVHCRNHVAVGGGNAADDLNIDIAAGATIRKDFSAAWAEGDLQGGLTAFPAIANQWYYGFVLTKEDGTADAGFDTSPAGAGLLALATAAGFNWARRVICFKTRDASTDIRNYFHFGDRVLYDAPTEDGYDFTDAANRDYSVAAGQLIQFAHAPHGFRTEIGFRFGLKEGTVVGVSAVWIVGTPDLANPVPRARDQAGSSPDLHNFAHDFGDNRLFHPGERWIIGSAGSPPELRFKHAEYDGGAADTTLELVALTIGWVDDRDKLF